jgi:hypothetical protein
VPLARIGDDRGVPVDREFLVAYDYGMGGLWAVLLAPSEAAIAEKYPELVVVPEPPKWMDSDQYQRLRDKPLWLDDDPPQGMLHAVVADRDK